LKVKKLELGFFKVNCYILSLDEKDIIIDPGADFNTIQQYLKKENIKPDFILNTHGHYDHIGAVTDVISNYNIPFYIHELEEPIIKDPEKNLSSFFGKNGLSLKTYNLIKKSDYNYFADFGIKIVNTAGHTPGSIIIIAGNCVFTGDLLFKESVGRTDLAGGDIIQMKKSLVKIKSMEAEMELHPGHGPSSTLEHELKNNYYLQDDFLKEDY